MGGSPLHIAAYEGHAEIVELLVLGGANINAKIGGGGTIFDTASEEIIEIISMKVRAANDLIVGPFL